jgi:hypothetical protein
LAKIGGERGDYPAKVRGKASPKAGCARGNFSSEFFRLSTRRFTLWRTLVCG